MVLQVFLIINNPIIFYHISQHSNNAFAFCGICQRERESAHGNCYGFIDPGSLEPVSQIHAPESDCAVTHESQAE